MWPHINELLHDCMATYNLVARQLCDRI